MTAAAPITATPFPIRLLTGALVLTFVVLLTMGWSAYDSYRNFVNVQSRDLRLAELRGVIVHLDEVLTMSARMAAITGDQQWERRYRDFEPTLDAAVKETMTLTPQSARAAAARQTDEANLKLVDMENQSFALARTRQTAEARKILFSEAYEVQKKIYAVGMAALIDDIKAGLAASQRGMWRRALFFGAAVLLSVGLLVFTWLTVLSRLNYWRVALAQAVGALRGARADLEGRVEERTFQLQAEVSERKRTEEGLRRSESQLAAAQMIARIGSWEWDIPVNQLTWSEENYRIHGFKPREFELSYESALQFVHPEERLMSDAKIKNAVRDGKQFSFEQRVVRRDGTELVIHQRGDVVLGPDGRVAKLVGTAQDVTELKRAKIALEGVHRQLLDASRKAGMADVATSVLHNVGNVLNSVNVSAMLVIERVRVSKVANIPKMGALLQDHATDLAEFLTNDPKGRKFPGYLLALSTDLAHEQRSVVEELGHLRKNIEHIKEIVAMQQNYAKVSGVTETVAVTELVDDALRMNESALSRHGLDVVRDFAARPTLTLDRHKVLQILVNVIRNAKYACDESGRTDKQMTVRVTQDDHRVRIAVIDNGVGISAENLIRIFAHGFTTRKTGHGFGLHSSALAAKELGGSLIAQSDGPGKGAMFILELPDRLEGAR